MRCGVCDERRILVHESLGLLCVRCTALLKKLQHKRAAAATVVCWAASRARAAERRRKRDERSRISHVKVKRSRGWSPISEVVQTFEIGNAKSVGVQLACGHKARIERWLADVAAKNGMRCRDCREALAENGVG